MVEAMVASVRVLYLRGFKIGALLKILLARVLLGCLRPSRAIRLMAEHLIDGQHGLSDTFQVELAANDIHSRACG